MKILIIGATGLVGKEILLQALELSTVSSVAVFVRRSTGLTHKKLREFVVDFDHLETWRKDLQGDVLFCALGTTLKAAGSESAQWRVDYDYQLNVARAARSNGVRSLVLISSTGADANSRFFYLKMKGKLEKAIADLGLRSLVILRPSLLAGDRERPRTGERVSRLFFGLLPKIEALSTLLPIKGSDVAKRALEESFKLAPGKKILEARDLHFPQ